MKTFSLFFALLLLSACGAGSATQKDEQKSPPTPDTKDFLEAEAKPLLVTPYMTQWKLNELYADITDFPGLIGTYTYSTDRAVELKFGYRGVQFTECSEGGGADPSFVFLRRDGSRTALSLEDTYLVEAGETVDLKVSMANPGKCHGLDITFGFNVRER